MITKRLVSFVVVAMMGLLFIAIVGARGSIGFSKGSVVGWGEIWGKIAKESYLTLEVAPHPDEVKGDVLILRAFCGAPGNSKIVPGKDEIEVEISFTGEAVSSESLTRIKRGVYIPYPTEDEPALLKALDSEEDLSYLDSIVPSDYCPNNNWHIVDAYPIGFTAIIRVYDQDPSNPNADIDQQLQVVCGVPSQDYVNHSSPFLPLSSDYICGDTESVKPSSN